MKYFAFFIIGSLLWSMNLTAQEYRGVTIELTVDNGQGRSQRLEIGVREGADSGLDPDYGEAELPPQPPNEIFDARVISTPGTSQLGLGSLADYRAWPGSVSTLTYTVSYQAGANASGVTLRWPETLPGRITALSIDGEEVGSETSLESPFASGQFIIEATFDPAPLQFTASPDPLQFNVSNSGPLPERQLTITPEGDPSAQWSLTADVDWLDILPGSGSGEQTVTVRVNTQRFEAGSYDGTILVSSPLHPASTEVDVRMEMIVGIAGLPAANRIELGRSYPNPAHTSAAVQFHLPEAMTVSLVVLDARGREVRRTDDHARLPAGEHIRRLRLGDLPPGVYTYQLRTHTRQLTRRLLLLR